jgi:polyphosphate kinase
MGITATPKDEAAETIELDTDGAAAPAAAKKAPARRAAPRRTAQKPASQVQVPGSGPKLTARGFTVPKNLRTPKLFLNRELTWLSFNRRVLNEARDPRTPLLERVKFLAIADMTLDEFIMKRIGGLKQQVGAGVHRPTVDGRTPHQQVDECLAEVAEIEIVKRDTYMMLLRELSRHGIKIVAHNKLTRAEKDGLREFYLTNIFPLVTPLAMDPAHPFPHLSNLSLNLLASLHQGDENESVMARVKVPVGSGVPRFLKIGDDNRFVALEEVMANNLDLLFPDRKIHSCEIFRVTRNANTEKDEEHADDLLEMIETELRDRRFAPIVRLQTASGIMPLHRGMLAAELGLDEEKDVSESDVMIGMKDLMEIASLDIPELHDSAHRPIDNVTLQDPRNIFHIIRENNSILLQHPYESFSTSVERFVREASRDPKVMAIKMTLYRTSAGTAILDYLMDAARNGKQVAVVVELKARFDEAANIQWANLLEEVGVHVTYGVVGLKTHAKAILVVRRDFNGLRRYAHIGTGNYHAGTARMYCDLGILTSDEDIGHDLTELFNYLTTGCKPSRNYRKILTAPKAMKRALLDKIDREIALHSAETPGHIRLKTNALEDADLVESLYRASQAGVKVDLIVRDTCRLIPGIKGLSENIRVVSIVGRFLEHTRIYNFMNGGQPEYYIGSADLMRRNLKSRVEIIAPIEDPVHQRELDVMLNAQLEDQRSVWDMQSDSSYIQRQPEARQHTTGCQLALVATAEKRHSDANRLRKRRLRGIARRAAP